jgi:23S rRNA (adenine1618-N6)-methyltransferase
MSGEKKVHPRLKSNLHPRNKHRGRYDFKQLIKACPALASYVKLNDYQDESIDFFDPKAVKMLNRALLKHFYTIDNWDIPDGYLCPPIPGRSDYIHYVADLLASNDKIPTGKGVKCLDIGVGANCVYPLIGTQEYGWSFIGSDIDAVAIKSATSILDANPTLKSNIELRQQSSSTDMFKGIIKPGEKIDVSICNPPFYSSSAEAFESANRKLRNLKKKELVKVTRNFGGMANELWCKGGEKKFVSDMIFQSKEYSNNIGWFTTLLSKEANLKSTYPILKKVNATNVKTIPMGQGNKVSRILAWTFL